MGGTRKSEVIKVFVYAAENVSNSFGWVYNNDVIEITALIGASVCKITKRHVYILTK